MFEFADMLAEYESDIQVLTVIPGTITNGGYDEETGEPIKGTPETTLTTPGRGVVLPYSANEMYQSGGRLTRSSRQLITSMDIEEKAHVVHQGRKYHVENCTGYEEHADFKVYELKWVSAFA